MECGNACAFEEVSCTTLGMPMEGRVFRDITG